MENPNFRSKMENFIFDPTAGPVLETSAQNGPGEVEIHVFEWFFDENHPKSPKIIEKHSN